MGSMTTVRAQNFMEHIRKTEPGKAAVTVTQSRAIDQLVNGKASAVPSAGVKTDRNKSQQGVTGSGQGHNAKTGADKKKDEVTRHDTADSDADIPVVDMRKKVMRGGHKITGYRVQAFAGGNTREDRQKAERIRNEVKMKFPDHPVYVHFYSPRWICRVGNYRSYEEAAWMLDQIQKMGYKSATIVKGKITVQY